MGWGICFALDENYRVYCSDGCNWKSRESDYEGFPKWPSARSTVLDYFEKSHVHRELDMIRDECPGTPAALREACCDEIGSALGEYDQISDEEKIELHRKTLADLEHDLGLVKETAKDAYEKYKIHSKIWKDYTKQPPVRSAAKTRVQELERLMEPLKLEYEMEVWAGRYDTYNKEVKRLTRLVKLEKQFCI